MFTINQLLTKVSRLFNGERITSKTNGTGTAGYLDIKQRTWIPTSYHIQTLIQTEANT